MDKIEAKALLEAFLHELKTCSYLELQKFISNPVCLEKEGQSKKIPALVTAVKDGEVTIDFNHPLAGKTLCYKLTLKAIKKT